MLSAEYRTFMKSLIHAAGDAFFGGKAPAAIDDMKISAKVNVEGENLDGQQHVDWEKKKCYVQITETVRDMGAAQPLLTKFAIAHELGHIVAGPIGDRIGTADAPMMSRKHEVAADLIGTCLLLRNGITPIMITSMLNSYGDYVMDEHETGTHPGKKDRLALITTLFPKIRSGGRTTEVEAIAEILTKVT
jgi:hypothetical protein